LDSGDLSLLKEEDRNRGREAAVIVLGEGDSQMVWLQGIRRCSPEDTRGSNIRSNEAMRADT
jgi:hypothetical protein